MKKILVLSILVLLISSCGNNINEQTNTETNTGNNIETNNVDENVQPTDLTPDEEKMINDILEIN